MCFCRDAELHCVLAFLESKAGELPPIHAMTFRHIGDQLGRLVHRNTEEHRAEVAEEKCCGCAAEGARNT